jgi:hypothetical protein
MKTRQKKVLLSMAVIGLILLGLIAGLALTHFLQVTEKESVQSTVTTIYPLNLQATIASEIFTANPNVYFLNTSMLNTNSPEEFQVVYEMTFAGNVSSSQVAVSGDAGIVLNNYNPCPAVVVEQLNATTLTWALEWYISLTPLPTGNTHYTYLTMTLDWDVVSGPLTVVVWAEQTT